MALIDIPEDRLHGDCSVRLLLAPLVLYPLPLRGQETCRGKKEWCIDNDQGDSLLGNDDNHDERYESAAELGSLPRNAKLELLHMKITLT